MANAWIQHVKSYAREHNCSYGDAMKGAKSTYRNGQSGSGIVSTVHGLIKKHHVVSRLARHFAPKAGAHAGLVRELANSAETMGYGIHKKKGRR